MNDHGPRTQALRSLSDIRHPTKRSTERETSKQTRSSSCTVGHKKTQPSFLKSSSLDGRSPGPSKSAYSMPIDSGQIFLLGASSDHRRGAIPSRNRRKKSPKSCEYGKSTALWHRRQDLPLSILTTRNPQASALPAKNRSV